MSRTEVHKQYASLKNGQDEKQNFSWETWEGSLGRLMQRLEDNKIYVKKINVRE